MRYAIVIDPEDPKYLHVTSKFAVSIEDNQAIVIRGSHRKSWLDIAYQDEAGVYITVREREILPDYSRSISKSVSISNSDDPVYNLLIPETHPLYNYGIIANLHLSYAVAGHILALRTLYNKKLVNLFNELKKHIK